MKALILTAKFGMGHYSAARSLKADWEKSFPGSQAVVKDILNCAMPNFSQKIYQSFELLVRRGSKLYNTFYKFSSHEMCIRDRLGIVHSMAHKTGAAFSGGHIIHGCANAMYLPKVIKFNSKNEVAAERYANIARFLGLKGSNTAELVDALIAELRHMNDELNIPCLLYTSRCV